MLAQAGVAALVGTSSRQTFGILKAITGQQTLEKLKH